MPISNKLRLYAFLALICITIHTVKTLDAKTIIIYPAYLNVTCTTKTCHPVSQLYKYNANGLIITSDTTIVFLYGLYNLESTIVIRDVLNVKLTCHTFQERLCQLHCTRNSSLVFVNVTAVSYTHLTLPTIYSV